MLGKMIPEVRLAVGQFSPTRWRPMRIQQLTVDGGEVTLAFGDQVVRCHVMQLQRLRLTIEIEQQREVIQLAVQFVSGDTAQSARLVPEALDGGKRNLCVFGKDGQFVETFALCVAEQT